VTYFSKSTHKIENISKAFRANENETFRYLYKTYKTQFVNSIQGANSGVDREMAIDLFQDSMVVLYDNVIQNKLKEVGNIKAYLFRVGQLLAYERLRKQKRSNDLKGKLKQANSRLDVHLDQYDFLNRDGRSLKAKSLLEKLGQRCRDLLIAFYYRNLTLEEIAIGDEYSNANSVKSQKFKCIQRLRNYTNEFGE